jgi:hypothetical protein
MAYRSNITIMYSGIAHKRLRFTGRMRRVPFWQLATEWIGHRAPLRADFEASLYEVSISLALTRGSQSHPGAMNRAEEKHWQRVC